MGGPALADILFGKESPSGKTPVTFPVSTGQVPIYYNHYNTGRPAQGTETLLKDIPVEAGQTSLGCTSFWLDAGFGPLFPFGYGLSYGDFEYSNLKLDKATYNDKETVTATVTLTNKGRHAATEVAQLYVRDMVGSIARPIKELKGFKRVSLAPGESQEVKFEMPVSELAFYGLDMTKKVEAGDFTLFVGGDSACTLSTTFKVE
jgi:beta-glucosidase